MESVIGPNVDPPDRLQVQEAPSAPALTGILVTYDNVGFHYIHKITNPRKETTLTLEIFG